MKALAEAAVDAALGAGASYADARAVSLRRQYVITKNGNIDDLSDTESEGIGVRVLVDGAWGFAGAGRLDESAARDAALRAAETASWHSSRTAGTLIIPPEQTQCAGEDLNLHGVLTPQGPQPCASTNSATSARRRL